MNDQTSTEVKNINEETKTEYQNQQDPTKLLRLNKAGILDQARLRPHWDTLRATPSTVQEAVVNTRTKCTAAGLSKNNLKSISYTLSGEEVTDPRP